jgi:hypothetical protein
MKKIYRQKLKQNLKQALLNGEIGRFEGFKFYGSIKFKTQEISAEDIIRILAARTEHLKARGYPQEWIERDLEKLVEGIL